MASEETTTVAPEQKRHKGLRPLRTAQIATATNSRWNRPNARAPQAAVNPTVKIEPSVGNTAGQSSDVKSAEKMERRQSKLSLFSLFAPPKVERSRGYTEAGLNTALEVPAASLPKRAESPWKPSLRVQTEDPVRAPSPQADTAAESAELRQNMVSRASTRVASSELWRPPPLFQAYSQSIKYATLQAAPIASEQLQKSKGQSKRLSSLQSQFGSAVDLTALRESSQRLKVEKSVLTKRFSTASFASTSTPNKVFILVQSGHLLQYSAEGNSGRLPERAVTLGKDSAAFASDLVPGKHYVLEVRESMTEVSTDVVAPKQSKGFFSRFRSQPTQPAKKQTTVVMLLVLNSPEEMIKWMKAVRRVIDDIKSGVHKTTMSDELDRSPPYKRGLTHRHRMEHETDIAKEQESDSGRSEIPTAPQDIPGRAGSGQHSAAGSPPTSTMVPTQSEVSSVRSSGYTVRTSMPESLEAASYATSNTTMSMEHAPTEMVRERSRTSLKSNRMSGLGVPTIVAPQALSSSPPSPSDEVASDNDTFRSPSTLRSSYMSPASGSNSRRRSFQRLEVTAESPPPDLPENSIPPSGVMEATSTQDVLDQFPEPKRQTERLPQRAASVMHSSSNTTQSELLSASQPRSQSALGHRSSNNRLSEISQSSFMSSSTSVRESSAPQRRPASNVSNSSRPSSSLGDLPNISNPSLALLHKQQLAQDAERIPASARKRFSRPIPIKVNVSAAPGAEQPVIPKRMSSLPSPRSVIPTGFPDPLSPTNTGPNSPAQTRSLQSRPVGSLVAGTVGPKRLSSSQLGGAPSDRHTALNRLIVSSSPTLNAGDSSPTVPLTNSPLTGNGNTGSRGLRRPMSLQVRSNQAAFLSNSRPQANSSARRSFTTPLRPGSAASGNYRNGCEDISPVDGVGETRIMKAIGPSNPNVDQPVDPSHTLLPVSEITEPNRHPSVPNLLSSDKRSASPMGVRMRVSMPTLLEGQYIEGVNGIKIPISTRPRQSYRSSMAQLPSLANLPLPPPSAPPAGPLPALPPPVGAPPSAPLPPVPGEQTS